MNRRAFASNPSLSISRVLLALALGAGSFVTGCGEDMTPEDSGVADAGPTDAGPPDAGPPDAGPPDAGPSDAGPSCTGAECDVVEIGLGILHACGRRQNGEVLCWGRNQELQLGDGRTRHDDCAAVGAEPADCSGTPVNVRFDDGSGRPLITDATAITMEGFNASCALRAGALWCWSEQTFPDVAGGSPRQRPVAERDVASLDDIESASVGSGHLCVINGTANAVSCAGSSSVGQLGIGNFTAQQTTPAAVLLSTGPDVPLEGVEEVSVSGSFTCARTTDRVYCWGRNSSDQFGDGLATVHSTCMTSPTDMFDCSPLAVMVGDVATPLGPVSDIDTGSSHACAVEGVSGPGQVVCWGDNRGGQTAQDDTEETTGVPTAVTGLDDAIQVATGSGFSCALREAGTVACWGLNLNGQLGDGVASHGTQCMSGSELVDCSRAPVEVDGIDDATAIAANASFACAVRADGSVWCWGSNNYRQLGDGTRTDRRSPVLVLGTDTP